MAINTVNATINKAAYNSDQSSAKKIAQAPKPTAADCIAPVVKEAAAAAGTEAVTGAGKIGSLLNTKA